MSIARLESPPTGGTQPAGPGQAVATAARTAALAALTLLVLLALARPARADIGETIILRCTHGQSLSGFSQSAYRNALKELSADTEEYSDCSSLIRQAQLAAAGAGGGSGAGPGGGTPVPLAATPAEQQAIAHAEHAGSEPVEVGGGVVDPGVVHVDIASALSSLPTPLLATLAFITACLLVFLGRVLRNRVRARRTD
jgi:hypothetical protein